MRTELHFSSKDQTWETPQWLFDGLNEEFRFSLDPCALPETAKCEHFYTPENNGLVQDWTGHTVFCNPPYNEVKYWIKKCYDESQKGSTVVMLIPAKTDTKYFHEYIYGKAEIRFLKGRLKFGGAKYNAPFPSMVVVFRPIVDK